MTEVPFADRAQEAMTASPKSSKVSGQRENTASKSVLSKIVTPDLAEAKITSNRFRWGSCTLHNNVNFNWRLIKAPMFVIDYVIVHELAHLIEANHTPRFWNIVRAQTPTMEKAKTWLKEQGQLLEQEI